MNVVNIKTGFINEFYKQSIALTGVWISVPSDYVISSILAKNWVAKKINCEGHKLIINT